MTSETASTFVDAVRCGDRVSGFTHNFYRYPARFSPVFARKAIETFTRPGELVVDPFVGGGTTLVEACALGRRSIGTDINSLAIFVSNVKTTVMSDRDLKEVRFWSGFVTESSNLHNPTQRDLDWAARGYQRNISDRRTWPIRKCLEFALENLNLLSTTHQRRFARCILLRTSQWALDCRRRIPSVSAFRDRLVEYTNEMISGAVEFRLASNGRGRPAGRELAVCLHRSAVGLETEPLLKKARPRLILTSPPYPGVHVLYHRWQVQGRRETPAAYWIADTLDGDGASFYTFGDRRQLGLDSYFEGLLGTLTSLAKIADKTTFFVQMIAFAEPDWQLPQYLATMTKAGFKEVLFRQWSDSRDGRLWRDVPNRKFYADQRGSTTSSREVVLVHRRV